MSTSLRIDNLPVDFSEEELRALARPYGTVLRTAMTVIPEAPAVGRGYVQMLTPVEAAVAKLQLHRTTVHGVEIVVFLDDLPEEPA